MDSGSLILCVVVIVVVVLLLNGRLTEGLVRGDQYIYGVWGTAPFCNGKCPEGWEYIRSCKGGGFTFKGVPIDCGDTCFSGSKAFCRRRYP